MCGDVKTFGRGCKLTADGTEVHGLSLGRVSGMDPGGSVIPNLPPGYHVVNGAEFTPSDR